MNLFDVVRRECIRAGGSGRDRDAVLAEIAGLAGESPTLTGVETGEIENALRKREALGSTGFGKAIAIPHCRLAGVKEFVVGLLTVPGGVPFDALDDKPVKLFVFIVAPATESDEHVRLLSGISRVLSIPGAVEEMIAAPSSEALMEGFLRSAQDKVDTARALTRQLFHVFVQEEEIFKDILQVFGAMEDGCAVTVDAENLGAYLARLPLFATFWTDRPASFSRLIVALVDKKLTNETVRRIEAVTGDLKQQSGVLVLVQDLFYCEGSLHP